MNHDRLSIALEDALFSLPAGPIAVFGATQRNELSAFDRAQVHLICGFVPDVAHFTNLGFAVHQAAPQAADLAVVFLPRAKVLAKGMIAAANATGAGMIVVDGQKTDGIDSILKDLRARTTVRAVMSKAHGKLLVVEAAPSLGDWALPEAPTEVAPGFVTLPGVFSADGIDPASRVLAAALPAKLGGAVVDLGAGWGYLGAQILTRDGVKSLDMVEADFAALSCARLNVLDPRARFHWADATTWKANARIDTVVMNPPFHVGRAADPDLGRAFISAAAALLAPSGYLWMVANRHLPYETTAAQLFAEVEEVAGDNRFKVIKAARPIRARRA